MFVSMGKPRVLTMTGPHGLTTLSGKLYVYEFLNMLTYISEAQNNNNKPIQCILN